MKHQLLPLILMVSSAAALAQAPGNAVPDAPDATPTPSTPASSGADSTTAYPALSATSLGYSSPREIVTPSTPSPPGGAVTLATIEDQFSRLDTNHDGSLSSEELNLISRDTISSSAARFRQRDTNHDGKVSAAEFASVQTALERGAIASNPLSKTPPTMPSGAAPTGAPTPPKD